MPMPYLFCRYCLVLCLFFGVSLLSACQSQTQERQDTEQAQVYHKKHRKHHQKRERDHQRPDTSQPHTQDTRLSTSSQQSAGIRTQTGKIPQKVYDVLAYVRANHRAMDGYVGGRRFGNFEGHLPRSDTDGKPIQYQEWDVNPKVQGRNRGTERLITGSDGHAWYTSDHYNTFVDVS